MITICRPELITNRVGRLRLSELSTARFPIAKSFGSALLTFCDVPYAMRQKSVLVSGSCALPQTKSGRGLTAHVSFGLVSGKKPVTMLYSSGGNLSHSAIGKVHLQGWASSNDTKCPCPMPCSAFSFSRISAILRSSTTPNTSSASGANVCSCAEIGCVNRRAIVVSTLRKYKMCLIYSNYQLILALLRHLVIHLELPASKLAVR